MQDNFNFDTHRNILGRNKHKVHSEDEVKDEFGLEKEDGVEDEVRVKSEVGVEDKSRRMGDVKLKNECGVEDETRVIDGVKVGDQDEIKVQRKVEDEREAEDEVGVEAKTPVKHAIKVKDEHEVEDEDDDKDKRADVSEAQLASSNTPWRTTTNRLAWAWDTIIYALLTVLSMAFISDAELYASVRRAMNEHTKESTHQFHPQVSDPFIPTKDVVWAPYLERTDSSLESSLHDETGMGGFESFFLEVLSCFLSWTERGIREDLVIIWSTVVLSTISWSVLTVLWEKRGETVVRRVWVAAFMMWKAKRPLGILGRVRRLLRPAVKPGYSRIEWACVRKHSLVPFWSSFASTLR